MLRNLAALALAATVAACAADAPTCGEAVDRLAAERELEARPPAPLSSGPAGSEIAPPATGDEAVIEPPPGVTAPMPTAPEVEPGPGTPEGENERAVAEAARRAQVDSLLAAARAAADRGDERQCLERLNEARGLL